jgi:hypothetical protein
VAKRITLAELSRQLEDIGATPEEASDYINEARDLLLQRQPALDPPAAHRESTPEGLSDDEREAFRLKRAQAMADAEKRRSDAVTAAGWPILQAKVNEYMRDTTGSPLSLSALFAGLSTNAAASYSSALNSHISFCNLHHPCLSTPPPDTLQIHRLPVLFHLACLGRHLPV